jgi:hypothetical protein
MPKDLGGHPKFDIVKQPHGASNGANVVRWRENACSIIYQIRDLVLTERPVAHELSHESDKNGVGGISEIVSATISKHGKFSGFRVVFCDDEGRLYRVDPQTGKYAPIRPPE